MNRNGHNFFSSLKERFSDMETNLQTAVILLTAFLIFYPMIWMVLGSLRVSIFDQAITIEWYKKAFSDITTYKALKNTLVLAGGGTFAAALIGLPLAWIVARTNTPLRGLIRTLTILPFVTTPMIMAVCWALLAYPSQGLLNLALRWIFSMETDSGPLNIFSLWGMIWILGICLSPYIFLITSAALEAMDPSLEEAASTSGSGSITTARRITLPLIRPAIVSSMLLCFVLAAGNFGVPAFIGLTAQIEVLTTIIFNSLRYWPPQRGLASAVALMLLIITMLGVFLQRRVLASREFVTIGGKGHRSRSIDLGNWKYLTLGICLLYILVVIVLPYTALIRASFMKYWTADLSLRNLTLGNYKFILNEYPITWKALKNSFLLSSVAATLCLILCAIISYILIRTKVKGRRVLDYMSMLPVSIPGIVFAVGLLIAYIRPPIKLYGTLYILIVSYVTLHIPHGVRSVSSSLIQIHKELGEAGHVSGANWLTIFRRITIPLVRPGIIAGWTLVFVTLMRELSSSILLCSPRTVVASVVLWDLWDEGEFTTLSAFSVILILITVTMLGTMFYFTRQKENS